MNELPLDDVLGAYLEGMQSIADAQDLETRTDRRGRGDVKMQSIVIKRDDRVMTSAAVGELLDMEIHLSRRVNSPHCALRVYDSRGQFVINCDSRLNSLDDDLPNVFTDRIVCSFPELLLMPGRYRVDAELFADGERQDQAGAAITLDVNPGRLRGRPHKDRNNTPIVAHPRRWQYVSESDAAYD